jgi:hypothetical protein
MTPPPVTTRTMLRSSRGRPAATSAAHSSGLAKPSATNAAGDSATGRSVTCRGVNVTGLAQKLPTLGSQQEFAVKIVGRLATFGPTCNFYARGAWARAVLGHFCCPPSNPPLPPGHTSTPPSSASRRGSPPGYLLQSKKPH